MLVPASLSWGLQLVLVWLWLVCAVDGPSTLLAAGSLCGAPPLLAEVRRRPWWVVPRDLWPRAVGAVLRHSWLVFAGCGGEGSLATPG